MAADLVGADTIKNFLAALDLLSQPFVFPFIGRERWGYYDWIGCHDSFSEDFGTCRQLEPVAAFVTIFILVSDLVTVILSPRLPSIQIAL